jgi:hypothetical protein
LLLVVLVLLRLSGWVGGAVVVPDGVGADSIVHDHDIADELWKCRSNVERHALL